MAANVALGNNNIITLGLGGGDAAPATINWTSSNKSILEVVVMGGQPDYQVQVRPISAGVATVTATLLDANGNQLQVVNQNVQIGAGDPETAAVAFTGSAPTAVPAAPGATDPAAPGASHLATAGAAPTVAAGAGAGTAPPAPTVAGNDAHGIVSWGTGTAPAAGAQVAVTFHQPYPAAPSVVLTANNDATQPLGIEVTGVTANGFTVSTHVAGGISQAAGTYAVEYEVQG